MRKEIKTVFRTVTSRGEIFRIFKKWKLKYIIYDLAIIKFTEHNFSNFKQTLYFSLQSRQKKQNTLHTPFCRPEIFQVMVPSCSSVLPPWIRSSLRSTLPSFCRPWDFASRRWMMSLSRAAFSYSLTWASTWKMVSLIRTKPCTRDLCSSVSAARSMEYLLSCSNIQFVNIWITTKTATNNQMYTRHMCDELWDSTFTVLDDSLHQDGILCDALGHQ